MVSLDKLSSKDIPLIAHHIVVFLLFCLLLFGGLNNLLHVVYVVLLILYHLFVGQNLSHCSVFICLYLQILCIHLFIILIQLHKFLILILYLFSKLVNCISHSLIFFLEFIYLVLWFYEILRVQITITSHSLI